MNVPPRTQAAAERLVESRRRLAVLRREGCIEESPILCREKEIEKRRCATLVEAVGAEKEMLPSTAALLTAVRDGSAPTSPLSDVEAAALAATVLEGLSTSLGAG
jgi:hypothetical protein